MNPDDPKSVAKYLRDYGRKSAKETRALSTWDCHSAAANMVSQQAKRIVELEAENEKLRLDIKTREEMGPFKDGFFEGAKAGASDLETLSANYAKRGDEAHEEVAVIFYYARDIVEQAIEVLAERSLKPTTPNPIETAVAKATDGVEEDLLG